MNDSRENTWVEQHFDIIHDFFKDPKYKKLVDNSLEIYELNRNPCFIFCLSASKDLLSQWRAYSHDGSGVSIGFRTKNLTLKTHPNDNAIFPIDKINYGISAQRNIISELCNKMRDKFDSEQNEIKKFNLRLAFGLSLVNWALIFKNPNFKEEKEWRIVLHGPHNSHKDNSKSLSGMEFRINSNKIISYYSYCFGNKFNSDLISEIVLGPKCKMSIKETEQFLSYHNLGKTKIVISKSTYR
ncbi:hypothetical protein MTsPCn5_12970 [Croceitalea sp. MTPC5]|uniref:DUF2971 domain-containing protein n=1 Tax=Croceitalea sp. MTPC5 TaxID=3056565 RepID=UPI002B380C4F|nr:hypothetical protein MTsPCn5_12970 [Croceitalea sp. MTPC5]